MKMIISGKNIDVTPGLRSAVEAKLGKLERYFTADTEIYVSKSITTVNQYELTKDGYLILQMPDLLTPGYYDINNSGVVYYTGILTE